MSTQVLTLHDFVDAYQVALDWLEEHEAEVIAAGGEPPAFLLELLDQAESDVKTKIGRVGIIALQLERQAEMAQNEAKRIAAIGKSYQNRADGLRTYLRYELRRLGAARVDTDLCKVRVQANAPRVRPTDPANIPLLYRIQPPPPPCVFDRDRALEDLKVRGLLPKGPTPVPVEPIPGITVEVGESVRIW